MNGAIMPDAQAASRQRFGEPLGGSFLLEEIQCRLGMQARAILEDRGAR